MPETLKLSTRTSLYEPIKIEIEHPDKTPHTYETKKLTDKFLLRLNPLEDAILKNEDGAEARWVTAMYGVDPKILAYLTHREVEDIYLYTARTLRKLDIGRLRYTTKDMKKDINDVKEIHEDAQETKETAEEIKKNVKRSGKKESRQ